MKLSERPNRAIPADKAEIAQTDSTPDPVTGCWNSNRAVTAKGYATIGWREDGQAYGTLVHRASWSHTNGKIPDGLVIDHMCHNRRCVNPDHLRAITLMQNNIRRNNSGAHEFSLDTCQWGHPLSMMKLQPTGKNAGRWRYCKGCLDEKNRTLTLIRKQLRLLEITYGLGDWHNVRTYRGARIIRQARVDAVRAGFMEEAA
jgi:hypothetical protein